MHFYCITTLLSTILMSSISLQAMEIKTMADTKATAACTEAKTIDAEQQAAHALLAALDWKQAEVPKLETVKTLLTKVKNLQTATVCGQNALALALAGQYDDKVTVPLITALLDAGVDCNKSCSTFKHKDEVQQLLPLMVAVYPLFADKADSAKASHEPSLIGNLACVELLLSRGAEIDAQDTRGNTALMHAVTSAQPHMVALLLKHKASVRLKNKQGETVFDLKGSYNHVTKDARIIQKRAVIDAQIQKMLQDKKQA